MRITIAAIGRLKGPEKELVARYVDRAEKAGRQLALRLKLQEFPESRAGSAEARKAQEAETLKAAMPGGAVVIALDERGKALDSIAFAEALAGWRDTGVADVVLAIGGPDGHGAALLDRATMTLSIGAMTWPHQLARLMIAEQVYRAVTILAGHPYHRA